jgi:hypothetical protein
MNPALTMSLADQHRRELTARPTPFQASSAPSALQAGRRRARLRVPRVPVPGYRVTWTRLSLAPTGAGRRRSWVIVISATRAQWPSQERRSSLVPSGRWAR